MAIVIEITPELESQIRQAAANAGVPLTAYIIESVTERLQPTQHRPSRVQHLPKIEAKLIQQINQSLSQIEWLRYRELIGKRQAETLMPDEQAELIALSNQIEEANVKRIKYVAQLAQVRKTTIPVIMKELGLKPATYA
ncbi:MAG: hypothetical protein U0350_32225 [Caldilineaceae bacterium]